MDCHHEHFRNHHRWCLPRILCLVIGGVAVAVLFALAFGWLVMLLWNWLMPSIFSLKPISYWQGFGLTVLAKLVFGGVHGNHRHFKDHLRTPYHGGPSPWRWVARDERAPGGDRRNWMYYREYWNERGREDFEEYLKKRKNQSDENDGSRE
jgi:hypothetical protein